MEEKYIKAFTDKLKRKYELKSEYLGNKKSVLIKHLTCGNTFSIVPIHIKNFKTLCPYCFKGRLTNKSFQEKLDKIFSPGEYTLLGDYKNTKQKVLIRHNICGVERYVMASSALHGKGCKNCAVKKSALNNLKTNKEFLAEFKAVSNGEYLLESVYAGMNNKILVKHNACGSHYWLRADSFMRGSKCKYCERIALSSSMKKTSKQFGEEVRSVSQGEYSLASPYTGTNNLVKIRHNKCRKFFYCYPYMFNRGQQCPFCRHKISIGEEMIKKFLTNSGISYIPQKTFPDCLDTNKLSYDFYVPSINLLIEYQGKQHYQPIEVFGGEKAYKKQEKHDRIKRNYAKTNGINLLCIPYDKDSYTKISNSILKTIIKICKAEDSYPKLRAKI